MAKNNRPQNQQEQKVVTKYDKKVQKRKEAQRKAERLPFRERSWHRHIKDIWTNCRLRLRKKEFMPFMQWAVILPFRQDRSSTGQTA